MTQRLPQPCHARRLFLLLALIRVMHAPALVGADESPRPNIVFILADDLGWQDVGFAGSRLIDTPHLDRLAREGVVFSQAYASAPNCAPTRACLLSGQVTPRHRVFTVVDARHDPGQPGHKILSTPSEAALPDATDTVAEVLKRAGYATALVGMWNLGRGRSGPGAPAGQGFDLYLNPKHLGFEQDAYRDDDGRDLTAVMTDEAVKFIGQNRKQPFFLYFAPHAVHGPFDPPPDLLRKYRDRQTDDKGVNPAYAATVEQLDLQIGRLMRQLEEWDLARNTLVVFTSDNGGDSGSVAPLRGGKGTLYEGGLRVPMIAAWPGRIAPAAQSARIALHMDLYATICEAAGVRPGPAIDGRSILPTLRGETQPEVARDLFWMRREGGTKYRGQDYYAVRRGPWKMLHNSPFEPLQLFNLDQDPLEQRDLMASEPKVAQELTAALQLHLQQAGAVPWQQPQPTNSSTTKPSTIRRKK